MVDDKKTIDDLITSFTTDISKHIARWRASAKSDLNTGAPPPEKDPVTGQYYYTTSQRALKELFGSPLPQGKYSVGPGDPPERILLRGWGAPWPANYGPAANGNTYYKGLDFLVDAGEVVFAAGPGRVSFVGVDTSVGQLAENRPFSDSAQKKIFRADGAVVLSNPDHVGYGGIFLKIDHTEPYDGYQTGYYQLASVTVDVGDVVKKGDPIGFAGGPGGALHWPTERLALYFETAYKTGDVNVLVPPTALVPNYWPEHADSTSTSNAATRSIPPTGSAGLTAVTAQTAGALNANDRATAIAAQDIKKIKLLHANHVLSAVRKLDIVKLAAYTAKAGYKGVAPVVSEPMAFDFEKGVWVVGTREDGEV